MPLIQLINIRKSYQDGENQQNNVLRGINMEVNERDFVAIKGASGSGKTTLLSILGTLLVPDEGRYMLNDTEIFAPDIDHSSIRNKQIGFIFQDHRLMPQYTVLENILLPTIAYASEANKEEIEYAHQLMKLTHISGIAGQYPPTLSGGEASRVAVCRALIMKPLLLLADEPTGQLDHENAENIVTLLSDINKNLHTTIIMVTHSEEISSAAHYTLTIKQGILH